MLTSSNFFSMRTKNVVVYKVCLWPYQTLGYWTLICNHACSVKSLILCLWRVKQVCMSAVKTQWHFGKHHAISMQAPLKKTMLALWLLRALMELLWHCRTVTTLCSHQNPGWWRLFCACCNAHSGLASPLCHPKASGDVTTVLWQYSQTFVKDHT